MALGDTDGNNTKPEPKEFPSRNKALEPLLLRHSQQVPVTAESSAPGDAFPATSTRLGAQALPWYCSSWHFPSLFSASAMLSIKAFCWLKWTSIILGCSNSKEEVARQTERHVRVETVADVFSTGLAWRGIWRWWSITGNKSPWKYTTRGRETFMVGCQGINTEGMMERQTGHQQMLTLVGESTIKIRVFMHLQASPQKLFIRYKEKTVTSLWKHLADSTWTAWLRLISPIWWHRARCLQIWHTGEDTVSLPWCSQKKKAWPESDYRKTSEEPKLWDILQNNWPMVFKNVVVKEGEERLRSWFRLKEVNERGQCSLSPVWFWTKQLIASKDIIWIIGEI